MENSQYLSSTNTQSTFCPEFEYKKYEVKRRHSSEATKLQTELRTFLKDYEKDKSSFSLESLVTAKQDILNIIKEEPWMPKISFNAFNKKLLMIENALKHHRDDVTIVSNSSRRIITRNSIKNAKQNLCTQHSQEIVQLSKYASVQNLFEIETQNSVVDEEKETEIQKIVEELLDEWRTPNNVTEVVQETEIQNNVTEIVQETEIQNNLTDILHESELPSNVSELLHELETPNNSTDILLDTQNWLIMSDNLVQLENPQIINEKENVSGNLITETENLFISGSGRISPLIVKDRPIDLRARERKDNTPTMNISINISEDPIDLSLKLNQTQENIRRNLKFIYNPVENNRNELSKKINEPNSKTTLADHVISTGNQPKHLKNIKTKRDQLLNATHSITKDLGRKVSDYFSQESNCVNHFNSTNPLNIENVSGQNRKVVPVPVKSANEFDSLWNENIVSLNAPNTSPKSKFYDFEKLIEKTVYDKSKSDENEIISNQFDIDLISNQSQLTSFTDILIDNMIEDNNRPKNSHLERYSKPKYIYKLTAEQVSRLAMKLHMNVDYLKAKIRSCLVDDLNDFDDISVIGASQTPVRLHKRHHHHHQSQKSHVRRKVSDRRRYTTNLKFFDTKFSSNFSKR